jgi:transposase InsO family protein
VRACGPRRVRKKKGEHKSVVRTAEQPGQALNIDLCFVPEDHVLAEKLPAVSGSSGHLVVERMDIPGEAPDWPGLVFGQEDLTYEEAMHQYAEATRDRLVRRKNVTTDEREGTQDWRDKLLARAERYRVRQRRTEEDLNWAKAKTAWQKTRQSFQALSWEEHRAQRAAYAKAEIDWRQCHQQRKETWRQRQAEDLDWHKRNKKRKDNPFPERTWIAILVLIDNCSRQCFGLPIFRSGSHVTSQEVVTALRSLLPAELAFVISDQGTHFLAKPFMQLAQEADFIHVPIYRHRPETNGIAERFVLTFKNWLRSKSWHDVAGLQALVSEFQPEYNDRPHQGLSIPGLSPNEFSKRVWL